MLEPGFYNMDCMQGMAQFPDEYFDLAIVDPPYGDGNQKIGGGYGSEDCLIDTKWNRFGGRFNRYKRPNCAGKKTIAWDVAPGDDYFSELFRVSRYQIIWGGNYFNLPPSRNFIVWRKLTISENFSMAMAEYAWTNIIGNSKVFECAPQGTAKETRFHPTQKPVMLYSWLLGRYAKPGYKILDTHVGSASSLIACHRAGLKYWGFEIDETYYNMARERLDKEIAQININDLIDGGLTIDG